MVNGRVLQVKPSYSPTDPYAEPNQLFRGSKDGRFEEVLPHGGTAASLLGTSRGAAFGDLDNDGAVDIVVSNRDGSPYVLRNKVGSTGKWIQFSVLDRKGRIAVGARLRIVTGERWQWRRVQPGYGFCSSNDPRVHCGLGTFARVDAVEVLWSRDDRETFGPFEAEKLHELRQGAGRRSSRVRD